MKTARLCALLGASTVLVSGALTLLACGGPETSAQNPKISEPSSTPPAATSPVDPNAGEIVGSVAFHGPDPDVEVPLTADPHCRELHGGPIDSGTVVADAQGHLANAFVYVSAGFSGPPPPPPSTAVELDQSGCSYTPRVLGLRVGQTLAIKNSDDTIHNVHGIPSANPEFNQGTPVRGMTIDKVFSKPDVMVRMKCDVHPWMSAWVGVLDHPYFAVSGTDGSFRIAGLPAGTYTLSLWHESLGTRQQTVTVEPRGISRADFDLTTP